MREVGLILLFELGILRMLRFGTINLLSVTRRLTVVVLVSALVFTMSLNRGPSVRSTLLLKARAPELVA